jgi:NAD-dependent deacetylase
MTVHIPQALIDRLKGANHVCVLTGAGISAESGMPTFRQAQTGLWERYRPEDLATPLAFRRDPRLVWDWYAWRRELALAAHPNPGHLALVRLQDILESAGRAFTLVTQNVDGLHQRAGSRQVIELHGSLLRLRCFDENTPVENWAPPDGAPFPGSILPLCPNCGSLLRPDVVWFGEALPADGLQAAWQAASDCDLFFSIGTSALVEPAASLPALARRHGALLVEVNPAETPLSATAHHVLRGPAGEILPALLRTTRYASGG